MSDQTSRVEGLRTPQSRARVPAAGRVALGAVLTILLPVGVMVGRGDEPAARARAMPEIGIAPVDPVPVGEPVVLQARAGTGPGSGPLTFSWRQVTEPDQVETIPALDCPTDDGDRYGTRLRGFLYPPATGDYTFWIASDDSGELRLSTDDAVANLRLVASVAGWTGAHEWDRLASQKSGAIPLRAGNGYAIEVLQKEGSGGDHVSVAWAGPGFGRAVVAGTFLSPAGGQPGTPGGGITREVWRDLPGGTVADLTRSPRFPGGCEAELGKADTATATFTATRSGLYRFAVRVGGNVGGADARTDVLITDRFANGDVETESGGAPAAWRAEPGSKGTALQWEETGGRGGSHCLTITAAAEPGRAAWVQTLRLAPYTPYLLRGYVKASGLRAGGKYGASLGVNLWKAETGPGRDVHDLDWTPFELDFATGPDGQVDVACKLGSFNDNAGGTVRFDDLTLVRNPEVETFRSRRFVLHLYRDEIALATRSAVLAIMDRTDRVCDAFEDLTGFNPGREQQSAWAPDKFALDALGWSGNPMLWTGDRAWIGANWSRDGYCPEVFLHELAHNYDHPNWTFHGHFNELKMAYALEVCDLGIAEDGWTRGAATRHRWEFRSRSNRENGICDELVQVYRNLQFRDQVGWEPFKKTFRWFLDLSPEQVPRTPWDKFKLWHDKLSEFAGADAWAVYSPEETAHARAYYTPRPDPESLPTPDAVAADRAGIPLTDTRWTAADVGWEKPVCGIYHSGPRLHANALYAHAPSRYSYRLGGAWKRLEGVCGLGRGHSGSVVFVVRGDGRELYRSDTVKDRDERPLTVDVTGVNELELLVEDGGDGRNSDWGMWFSPGLTR